MESAAVGLVFSLGLAETEPGEEIWLTGSCPVLGRWNPDNAVSLSTDPVSYPRWSTAVIWFPNPAKADGSTLQLEYKYLRDRRALDGTVVWEDSIPNRNVTIDTCGKPETWQVNDDSWGCLAASPPRALSQDHLAPAAQHSEMDFVRLVSPLNDKSLEGTHFTPTLRHAPDEAWSDAPRQRMAREDSSIQMAREWSVSSMQISPSPSCSGLTIPQADDANCSSDTAVARTGGSLSCLPACGDESTATDAVCSRQGHDQSSTQGPLWTSAAFEAVYALDGEAPLGEGSFGLVWSCRHREAITSRDGGRRAVKRIAKKHLKPRDVNNLFGNDNLEGEIRMHLRLKHPNVVAMHEVFDDGHVVSLVMECCSGGDLFDLISTSQTGLCELSAARALQHLLKALSFLHSLDIVHRDVKCENVLCLESALPTEQSTFKLCDFGFAAALKEPHGHLKTRLGSPDAVAPEVVAGKVYSKPVDCWAAGVLLYMALSATSPFWGRTDLETLRKVKRGEYSMAGPRWESIGAAAKDAVRQLLTFEPEARAAAADALNFAWLGAQ